MPMRKPQAIVITPNEAIVDVLSEKVMPGWDFRKNVKSYKDFWKEAERDNNIEVILIPSIFFTDVDNPEPYQEIVTQASTSCFVAILDYNANNPTVAASIRSGISEYSEKLNIEDAGEYYFVNASNIGVDLPNSVDRFIHQKHPTEAMKVTIDILQGKEPQDKVPSEEENFYFENSADVDRIDEQVAPKFANDEPVLGKFIAVTSSKGGPGKSTIAMTLATYLAQKSIESVEQGLEKRPLKVLLMDMDVFDGQVGFLTNKTKPNIAHLFNMDNLSKENIEKNVVKVDNLGISVLLASKNPKYQRRITIDFYKELCAYLQHMYDYIIFDTSVQYMEELMCQICYPQADKIIFVTESVVTSVLSMVRWIRFFAKTVDRNSDTMNIPKEKIGIVVNKFLGKETKYGDVNFGDDKIKQASQGIETIGIIPSMPSLVASCANNSQMDRLVRDPGFGGSLSYVAKYVVGDDYKLPEFKRK